MASWRMYEQISTLAANEKTRKTDGPASAMLPEFKRLNKQRCAYCSGFGHSGKDCPTDAKISRLRGGV